MGIDETLAYIHSVKWQGSKPGLGRTRELLAALGNPEKKLKFVHVAGTNGKGSVCACVASVLTGAGYVTGLYTSPHLASFNERMQTDGEMITDAELELLTEKIRPFADAMADSPTEFEIITAIAMSFFVMKMCDIVVLETGLGGELDSTNVVGTPEVAVITAIGLDHTAELGATLADIAAAKAGIIKPGGIVAVYGGQRETDAVFETRCRDVGASLRMTDFSRLTVRGVSLDAIRFDFEPIKDIKLPLIGSYQPKNAALAITALECLRERGYNISDGDIARSLGAVRWPGRFEVLCREPLFILDGAHNAHGMEATAESLSGISGERGFVFIVGVMADKDVVGMMDCIAPLAREFIATRPPVPRAMDPRALAELLGRYGAPVTVRERVGDAVSLAFERARAGGCGICALGSLYFSGDVKKAAARQTGAPGTAVLK
ncbi:MAG: bifunctional folylpolyglutamate synthase/dihydrofolate synthase [Oscillospiraceae bacterium]|jgi:dihydrofolate synthase/folylpolyglutamate synthase|nr:bifunctional folylpolyglutamate synthase/dihydrofolate synthase [Oscillospiraceae bacterium]